VRVSTSSQTSTRKTRSEWIDLIKATSVILVVFFHSVQALSFVAGGSFAAEWWTSVSIFLEPLRMPVFFVVSGMLASSAVRRPWSDSKSRTIGIAYLFLLWHTLMTLFTVTWSLLTTGELSKSVAEISYTYVVQIFTTPGGYWYFYALVLYFVIARLVRNVHPFLVLGVAAALNLMRPVTTSFINEALAGLDVSHMMGSVVMNTVYFLAGVYLVTYIKDLARLGDTRLLVASGVLASGASLWRVLNPSVWGDSFLWIAIAWVVFAVLVAVRVARHPAAAALASYVGPRTLPIFVIQFPILHVTYWVLGNYGTLVAGNVVLQLIFPVLLTAAITWISLVSYDAAMSHRSTRWLFAAPRSWVARPIERQLSDPATARQSAESPRAAGTGDEAVASSRESRRGNTGRPRADEDSPTGPLSVVPAGGP